VIDDGQGQASTARQPSGVLRIRVATPAGTPTRPGGVQLTSAN
jgi:hypothetical protein